MLKFKMQPIDRVALSLIALLSLLSGMMIMGGDRSRPKVRNFSWNQKRVSATDTAFILTFSHPMNQEDVKANLRIEPPLPGKMSWSGQRLVYTLMAPPRYETNYRVKLENATARVGRQKTGNVMQPFTGQFQTPKRSLAYIGVEGEEKGRLILYQLTQRQKVALTPKNLVVKNFEPYPRGDRLLFSAVSWENNQPGLLSNSLYTVTTGRASGSLTDPKQIQPAGKVDSIVDSEAYQNLKFDLSPDGHAIAVQRANRSQIEDISLWLLRANLPPLRLTNYPAGDFIFAPDSTSIFNPRSEGIAILPLVENAQPLDFIPSFKRVLDFTPDGRQSAMVKYHRDTTPTLFLVTNQGLQKELTQTPGQILSCQFSTAKPELYCLITRPQSGKEYSEQLNLEAIDLNHFKKRTLAVLPDEWETQLSLSPDGRMLLFDRIVEMETEPQDGDLRTNAGRGIATSKILLLDLEKNPQSITSKLQTQELPLRGFQPRWLP